MKDIDSFILSLPTSPGIYRMLDDSGTLLYVGKAKNLKNRLTSYFRGSKPEKKVAAMMSHVSNIELTLVNNENEALLLENNLIKQYRPRYNVLLKDDKSYPFLLLCDKQEFPRLDFQRGSKKQAGKTFGPYPNVKAVRDSLTLIQKLFKLRQCSDSFFKHRTRPCLQYQINRCTAPCVGYVMQQEYAQQVKLAVLFLEGKNDSIIQQLNTKMTQASHSHHYEQAAHFRDTIAKLRTLQRQQTIVGSSGNVDIIGIAQSMGRTAVSIVFVRSGRVLGHKTHFPAVPASLSATEVMEAFIPQYYLNPVRRQQRLTKIIVGIKLTQKSWLQSALQEVLGNPLKLTDIKHASYQSWLSMVQSNAQYDLGQRLNEALTATKQLLELQQALKIATPIERIECFDISHTQGTATVASCVVYTEAGLSKQHYRRITIEGITPGDDYAAMRQALLKCYTKRKEKDANLPDLLLIDGGKGQLTQAIEVVEELQISGIQIVAVAKGVTRKPGMESLFLWGHDAPIALPPDSVALHLIQLIRDEAHRFAITGHRAKRAKQALDSPLASIEGIGPKRRQALLNYFGGMQALVAASPIEIAKVPGISDALAKAIYEALH